MADLIRSQKYCFYSILRCASELYRKAQERFGVSSQKLIVYLCTTFHVGLGSQFKSNLYAINGVSRIDLINGQKEGIDGCLFRMKEAFFKEFLLVTEGFTALHVQFCCRLTLRIYRKQNTFFKLKEEERDEQPLPVTTAKLLKIDGVSAKTGKGDNC